MHGTNNNNGNLQASLQAVMETAIGEVLQDYRTLFASSPQAPVKPKSCGDEANFSPPSPSSLIDVSEGDLLARHKIGKAVLSHLEALLKIYDHWLGRPEKSVDESYKQSLIDEAKDSLNPPHPPHPSLRR